MDDANDNIFTAGIGGPQSEPKSDSPVKPASVGGIEGRIDPVAARANSAGGESGGTIAGTGSDSEPAVGAKRGRGRPRKTETISATVAGSEPLAKNETPRNIRASFIERLLFSIHMGVAKVAEAPEFKLDQDDAKELGEAIAGVLALHKVKITPAQEAYSILFEAAAKIYPPMVISYVVRKKAESEGRGKILNWPRSAAPAQTSPQTPAPTPQKESILPPGFDPTNIHIPREP